QQERSRIPAGLDAVLLITIYSNSTISLHTVVITVCWLLFLSIKHEPNIVNLQRVRGANAAK
ncbi:hypothetical protein ACRZ0B_000831, partial [Klebsiella quasipneumoniae]